jgi:hypothetical protein
VQEVVAVVSVAHDDVPAGGAPEPPCGVAPLPPVSPAALRHLDRGRSARHVGISVAAPTRNPLPFCWLPDRITITDIEAALIRQGTQMVCDGKEFVAGCDCVASNQHQATAR